MAHSLTFVNRPQTLTNDKGRSPQLTLIVSTYLLSFVNFMPLTLLGESMPNIEASTLEEARINWCVYVQRIVENYTRDAVNSDNVVNTIYTHLDAFLESKPRVENGKIYTSTYFPSVNEVKADYEQVWCKINTASRIDVAHLGFHSLGEHRSNSIMNKLALNWAYNYVDEPIKNAYKAANITINYRENQKGTGLTWSYAELIFQEIDNKFYGLETPYLRTGNLFFDALSHKHYCKLLSPQGAVDFIDKIS